MPRVLLATEHPFIYVGNDDEINLYFRLSVIEALAKIASEETGRYLLQRIADAPVAAHPNGWKVKISRPRVAADLTPASRGPGSEGGSMAAANDEGAAQSGAGSVSYLTWNPNIYNTPNGARPNYIALAHELVHCMHNAEGTKKRDYDEEESFTVGIGDYAGELVTENNIRAEHGIAARTEY